MKNAPTAQAVAAGRWASATTVAKFLGISRASVWRLCRDENSVVPAPIHLSATLSRFDLDEIKRRMNERKAA